ncbi:adenylyl cyclase CyaB, putative [Shewanella psychrophila]|uniref:Adenylyl cyclase CyaB, putative n=1 Tax=Shewanella psychrophila TaxID=225848 RepID=A0A1S6HS48_9GAMM|nr:class IV adenylate cyclase [Shewanella psychrophila]AQS38356.1 adenylyl cyclase CyaB, putative [Shewanella psychrophila]
MNKHFEGRYEVELKYRLNNRAGFIKALAAMTPEVMHEDNLEHDTYFDLPDLMLASQNKSVCIREIQPSGIMLWIVKGPEADRCEAVNINDAVKARSMLKTMGYRQCLELKKLRSIYFLGEFHVTLDRLEGLGDFAELAIMTDDESMLEDYRQQLLSLGKELGLSPEQLEVRSYRELQAELVT